MDSLGYHRFHFAFTITYHYLFPQLTMGLALVIVVLLYRGAFRADVLAKQSAQFLLKIFGLNFVMGVVTGIPMEFQFGANWSRFSEATGSVIGQTLAMEGIFAFFLESTFLYFLLFGEKKLSPKKHFACGVAVLVGSWLSAYFVIVTHAFMQHPTGYAMVDGKAVISSLSEYLLNPWGLVELAHTLVASLITASFVVAALGAFYLLSRKNEAHGKMLVSLGVCFGVVASVLIAMPTGDLHAKMVAKHQPVTFAAMEAHFRTEDGAGMVLIGQPNPETMTIDNPIVIPKALSFMTHQRWNERILGLEEFPRSEWPDHIPLVYFSYHVMVGLGTMFMAIMGLSAFLLWRKRLFQSRAMLWVLMLAFPFPYIANTAGWMTAEVGRQPWLVYGLMRTKDGSSDHVSSGNVLFSLLGFMGIYALLSLLFFILFVKIVGRGPSPDTEEPAHG